MRKFCCDFAFAPADTRSVPSSFGVLYVFLMVLCVVVLPTVLRRAMPAYQFRSYQISARIGSVPLFASGAAPVAIVALGGRPRGVIAIGRIAFGVIAVGGVAMGGLAIGGLFPRILPPPRAGDRLAAAWCGTHRFSRLCRACARAVIIP